jgi:hypothetical protein
MNADRDAPVYASNQIDISADPNVVWSVVATIDEWPRWNPDVKQASLEGELAEGSVFRWKAGPGTIKSTLRVVDPPREISWTGVSLGVEAIHVWRIEGRDGGSSLSTEESWDGVVARLFRRSSQRTLDKALRDGPVHVKAEAERRASAPLSQP